VPDPCAVHGGKVVVGGRGGESGGGGASLMRPHRSKRYECWAWNVQVDIQKWGGKNQRIHKELTLICGILCGLVVAEDYKKGQALVTDRHFASNADFFRVHPPPPCVRHLVVFPGGSQSCCRHCFVPIKATPCICYHQPPPLQLARLLSIGWQSWAFGCMGICRLEVPPPLRGIKRLVFSNHACAHPPCLSSLRPSVFAQPFDLILLCSSHDGFLFLGQLINNPLASPLLAGYL